MYGGKIAYRKIINENIVNAIFSIIDADEDGRLTNRVIADFEPFAKLALLEFHKRIKIKDNIINEKDGMLKFASEKENMIMAEKDNIVRSKSYRIGRGVLWLPRTLKEYINKSHYNNNELK
jgi:hypothetical protein